MSEQLRLGFYCTGCMPGYHLPFLAGADAGGIFSNHGLDVEILEPLRGPQNTMRVADDGADVCLTSVAYFLQARNAEPDLAARFVYMIGKRFPMSGIVGVDSPIRTPADLAGKRIGGPADDRLVIEYQAAMGHLGLEPGVLHEMPSAEAHAALGRGEVDAIPDFADLVPRVRRNSGIGVRAVRLGVELYHNGLVAADRLSDDTVRRLRQAVTEALKLQRSNPETGLDRLVQRYPNKDPADAVEQWDLAEPTIFDDAILGSLDPERWASTVSYVGATHGLASIAPSSAYRAVADELASAGTR